MFMDADERLNESEHHKLHFLADALDPVHNAIAFPRIDWHDLSKTKAEKDYLGIPDYQARMSRLHSQVTYVRKLHEQIQNANMYVNINNPVLDHFHRCAGQEKRDQVGKVCAKLHHEDTEFGHTYPKHHKADEYLKRAETEGVK